MRNYFSLFSDASMFSLVFFNIFIHYLNFSISKSERAHSLILFHAFDCEALMLNSSSYTCSFSFAVPLPL